MKHFMLVLIITGLIIAPIMAGATDETDFQVKTTENLINLCTTSSDDPLHAQAVNFCHGYLVGAYHYDQARAAGSAGGFLYGKHEDAKKESYKEGYEAGEKGKQ